MLRPARRRRVREHLAIGIWQTLPNAFRHSLFAFRFPQNSLPLAVIPSLLAVIPTEDFSPSGGPCFSQLALSSWHLAKALHPEPLATDYRLLATGVNYPLTTIHYPQFFPLRDGLLSS